MQIGAPVSRERDSESQFGPLLVRAQSGRSAAIAVLHRRYVRLVAHAAKRALPRRVAGTYSVVDICQSVFADLVRDLPTLEDRGEGAFKRMLVVRARNKALSKYRRATDRHGRARQVRLGTHDDRAMRESRTSPRRAAERGEDTRRVRREVGELTAADRRLLRLRATDGRSFADIATDLQMASADAARMRYTRLLARLRKSMSASQTS